jgi:hypothetical protein
MTPIDTQALRAVVPIKPKRATVRGPHPDAALFDGIPDSLIWDFAAVRKAKRAPITATAINGIKREAAKAGMTFEQAITLCVEQNWQGFRAEWALRLSESSRAGRAAMPGKFDPLASINRGSLPRKDFDDAIIDIN